MLPNLNYLNYNNQLNKKPVAQSTTEYDDKVFGVATGNLVCSSSNIVASNFMCFAANNSNGQEVPTGNRASHLQQQQRLNTKTWSPNFCCALCN